MDKKRCQRLWDEAYRHSQEHEESALKWAKEIDENTFKKIGHRQFLREYCFVVYASGFRFQTVKKAFPRIENAFLDFDPASLAKMRSIAPVLRVFGNRRKAQNFLDGAHAIALEGFASFKQRAAVNGSCVLEELPGIGKITSSHLAKNIGLVDTAKPDVWLARAAKLCQADSVAQMVDHLHILTGERRHFIDVVLWIYGRDENLGI